jgi:hypothetical protein
MQQWANRGRLALPPVLLENLRLQGQHHLEPRELTTVGGMTPQHRGRAGTSLCLAFVTLFRSKPELAPHCACFRHVVPFEV